MSIGLVFAHGWGFDSSYFKRLSQYFSNYPQVHWEAGYVDQAKPYRSFPEKGDWIGVGHSFGFHQLLRYPFKGVISLAGFTRFCIHKKGQEGVPLRVLNRMIEAFQQDPQGVLKQFWEKCGLPYQENPYIYPSDDSSSWRGATSDVAIQKNTWMAKPLTRGARHDEQPLKMIRNEYINTRALLSDLKEMRDLDEESFNNSPVLSLYNQQDPIVSASLIRQTFKELPRLTCIGLPYDHHVLGYKNTRECAEYITKWIQNVGFSC